MWFRSLLLCSLFTLCVSVRNASAATETVAVLPFFNNSKDANLDWVGESVAETLREALSASGVLALSRDERVEVYHRLSVRSGATLTRATVLRIGQSLDAGEVLFGQFDYTPAPAGSNDSRGTLRLTASAIDLKRFHEGPQLIEAGRMEDLSLLESRLAWQAIKHFQPRTAPAQDDYLRNRPPVRIEAVESYVRGLLAGSPDQQQKLFQQSAKLDARYSEPAFQLGRMTFDKKDYRTASVWLDKVASTDSHYHEARFLYGLCQYYAGDFDAAAQTLQQVAAQVPLNEVFNDLAAAQSRKNRPGAIENFRKALEGDETDPDYWFNMGYVLWKNGRAADAARDFQAVLDRTPDDADAKAMLARCNKGDLPRSGEALNGERIKKTFEETVFLQLQAELKK